MAAVAYLVAQAAAVLAWWGALAWSDAVRRSFELDAASSRPLDAFLLGDLVLLAAGSLAGAWLGARRSQWAALVAAGVAGAAGYATLYLAAWVLDGGRGAVGLAPMAAATVGSGWSAVSLRRSVGG